MNIKESAIRHGLQFAQMSVFVLIGLGIIWLVGGLPLATDILLWTALALQIFVLVVLDLYKDTLVNINSNSPHHQADDFAPSDSMRMKLNQELFNPWSPGVVPDNSIHIVKVIQNLQSELSKEDSLFSEVLLQNYKIPTNVDEACKIIGIESEDKPKGIEHILLYATKNAKAKLSDLKNPKDIQYLGLVFLTAVHIIADEQNYDKTRFRALSTFVAKKSKFDSISSPVEQELNP